MLGEVTRNGSLLNRKGTWLPHISNRISLDSKVAWMHPFTLHISTICLKLHWTKERS